jgi:hypothetical protein
MKKRLLLPLVLFLSIMTMYAGPGDNPKEALQKPVFASTTPDPVLFRYKLKTDQIMLMAVDMNTDIQMKIGARKMDVTQNIRIEAKARVTEVDEAGTISVLVKITRMTMDMTGGPQPVAYDSDQSENAGPDFEAVSAMIGVGIPCKISPVGEMLETDLEPLRLAVRRVNNAAMKKAIEDSAGKMVEGTFVQLSQEPIAAGQTYQAGTIIADPMKASVSYTIASVSGDKRQALMTPTVAFEFPADSIPGGEAKLTQQKTDGWILFDLENGYSGAGRVNTHIVLEMTANKQTVVMEMTMKVVSTATLQ